jgi:AAA domain
VSEPSNVAYALSALDAEDVTDLMVQQQWVSEWNSHRRGVESPVDEATGLVLEDLRSDGTIAEIPVATRVVASSEFRLEPLDVADLLARDPEPCRYLNPLLPERRRVWAFGASETAKSIWALWLMCRLTRDGRRVTYISQENPLDEEIRRLRRLKPDPAFLRFFHDAGLDLMLPDHVAALRSATEGADAVVLDTLTACWSGPEDDNGAIAAFDREVLMPITAAGATVLTLDHTGHPQAFVRRRGVNAGRGASAKGQKADVVLEFIAHAEHEFVIRVGKMRAGDGRRPPDALMRVVDTEDGGLDIESVPSAEDVKIVNFAEAVVEVIHEAACSRRTRSASG